MNITIHKTDSVSIVTLVGRLDTNTAPQLESTLNDIAASKVVIDCSALEYVSSAGLRVILAAHKRLAVSGEGLTLRGVGDTVRSVLDMTGFSRILTIE